MKGWDELSLDSAPLQIIDGDRGKAYPKHGDFSGEGYCLFLSATNVTKSGFDFSECQFISEQKDEELRKGKLARHDVVLTTRGTLGNAALYVDDVPYEHIRINSGMVLMRTDPDRLLPAFLYCFLRSPSFKAQVEQLRSGVAQPQLPIRDIKKIKLSLPRKEIQTRIADILSAYDDLIENNRRRMALLEESARQLYREWFVQLRFPGHEHARIVDGVPEGWARVTIGTIAEVQSGFAFKSSTYLQSGEYGIVTIKNVHDGNFIADVDAFLDELPNKMPQHCLLSVGDILLSLTGNIGRACLVSGDGYLLNQRVAKLVPRTGFSRAFAYFTFREENLRKRIEAISYGVAQQNLSPVKMRDIPIELPPKNFIRQFSDFADTAIDQILNLKQQNQKLRAARDLLLPRLMSGEVVV